MKSISGKDFAKILERNDWKLLRIHGSHHIYGKTGSIVRISLPIHTNKVLKIGLLKHLLSLANLTESDLD